LINIFFLLLITPLDLSIARKCIFSSKYVVHIINKLPSRSSKLEIHCASKDNDLGYHNLTTNQDFNWSFCETFLNKTLFFCHFWWGLKEKKFDVFNDPYTCVKGSGNPNVLTNCKWEVRKDGFYLEQYNNVNDTYYMYHYLEWS
ncbi:hypothetical protein A4A49_65234, partial [Nicotiana attenuata]